MKVTVVRDNGHVVEYDNVVDYGIVDNDEIEAACDAAEVTFSDEIVNEVKRRCENASHLYNFDELVDVVLDINGGN